LFSGRFLKYGVRKALSIIIITHDFWKNEWIQHEINMFWVQCSSAKWIPCTKVVEEHLYFCYSALHWYIVGVGFVNMLKSQRVNGKRLYIKTMRVEFFPICLWLSFQTTPSFQYAQVALDMKQECKSAFTIIIIIITSTTLVTMPYTLIASQGSTMLMYTWFAVWS